MVFHQKISLDTSKILCQPCKMTDLKRHSESYIKTCLSHFPAVMVVGARQCGKTHLSRKVRPRWKYFDFQNIRDKNFIMRDKDFFFQEYPRHIILDEAQEAPEVFKHLRGVIDRDRKTNNRFLITGSSSPELMAHASDSLAGRLALIQLGTLKTSEIRCKPLSPFFRIFHSPLNTLNLNFFKSAFKNTQDFDICPFILKGGYPEPVLSRKKNHFQIWMKHYFDTYINRDIRKLYPRLDMPRFQRFVWILSDLSGTIINRSQVGRSLELSELSVKNYMDIADKTYLWRQIHYFAHSKEKSLVKMPKGFLRDSGLVCYLLDINKREKLLRSLHLGKIFEGFVTEEIIKGMDCHFPGRWGYYYYRTKNGAEIDLILEGDFGLLPIEIKFSTFVTKHQLITLHRFVEKHKLPFAVLINNSREIKKLSPKVIQIPACFI